MTTTRHKHQLQTYEAAQNCKKPKNNLLNKSLRIQYGQLLTVSNAELKKLYLFMLSFQQFTDFRNGWDQTLIKGYHENVELTIILDILKGLRVAIFAHFSTNQHFWSSKTALAKAALSWP